MHLDDKTLAEWNEVFDENGPFAWLYETNEVKEEKNDSMRPSHLQSPVLPTEQPQEGSVLTDQIFQYEMQAPVNLENVEKTWQSPGYNAFAACQSQSVAIESVQQTPQYYLYQDNVHIDDSMMENKVVEQLQPAPFTFEGAIGKLMQVPVNLENVQKTWQLYPYNAYAASQNQSVGMNQGYVHFEDSIMENNTVKQQEPNRLTFEEAIEKFNEWKLKNQETLNLEIENINVDILLFNKNGTRQVPQKIRKFSNSYYFHLFFKKSKEDKENWDVYYRLKWMKAYQKISQCQEELQKMGLVELKSATLLKIEQRTPRKLKNKKPLKKKSSSFA